APSPESRREDEELSRRTAPPRVRDTDAVGGLRLAMHDVGRLARGGRGQRGGSGAASSRHSTRPPASIRGEPAGRRISALARASDAMSWLPADANGSTRLEPPDSSQIPSR